MRACMHPSCARMFWREPQLIDATGERDSLVRAGRPTREGGSGGDGAVSDKSYQSYRLNLDKTHADLQRAHERIVQLIDAERALKAQVRRMESEQQELTQQMSDREAQIADLEERIAYTTDECARNVARQVDDNSALQDKYEKTYLDLQKAAKTNDRLSRINKNFQQHIQRTMMAGHGEDEKSKAAAINASMAVQVLISIEASPPLSVSRCLCLFLACLFLPACRGHG